jgi:hypothetical protein
MQMLMWYNTIHMSMWYNAIEEETTWTRGEWSSKQNEINVWLFGVLINSLNRTTFNNYICSHDLIIYLIYLGAFQNQIDVAYM